jgi:integrase
MGKRWRRYQVGKYRLGQLNGRPVVVWNADDKKQRRVLGPDGTSEVTARQLLETFARKVQRLQASQAVTVGELFTAYRADRELDGKQVANFDYHWKALAPRFSGMPVDVVDANPCRDYARQRLSEGVSQGTIWTELTLLRSCLNWAAKRRVIDRAPYVWLPQKPQPRSRVLTEDEVIRLIDACHMPHVRLFVVLAITTAARSAALLELKWSHVDFDRGTIDLRADQPDNPLLKTVRKGRAVVPISDLARVALLEAKAGALTDYVIEWAEQPVKKIRKGFEAATRRAGLKDVTPHILRHTAASWSVNGGISMELTAKLLGHKNPNTTRSIYVKTDPNTLKPAADVIDMRLRRK